MTSIRLTRRARLAMLALGTGNCSITGGYVYRGSRSPTLSGVYFFADVCSGRIWALQQTAPGVWHMDLS